jgi:hypothetical protein
MSLRNCGLYKSSHFPNQSKKKTQKSLKGYLSATKSTLDSIPDILVTKLVNVADTVLYARLHSACLNVGLLK